MSEDIKMRSGSEVYQRLKQLRFRRRKREIEALLTPAAENCKHNLERTGAGGQSIRICKLDCNLCDAVHHPRAQGCRQFTPRHEAEEIKKSWDVFIDERPLTDIAVRYPDVAQLLWVLCRERMPADHEDVVRVGEVDVLCASTEDAQSLRNWLLEQRSAQAVMVDVLERTAQVSASVDALGKMLVAPVPAPWYRRLFG